MIVAIMQPSYLGWSGYFSMIDECDLFILLDTVEASHQSWQTRNRVINSQGNETWLSVPVHAPPGTLLHDVPIIEDGRWRRKHRGTLNAITKQPMPELLQVFDREWAMLTDLTAHTTRLVARLLGITTPIVLASTYGLPRRANPLDRLAELLERTGASEFLTAGGSSGYLNTDFLPVGGNPNMVPIRFHQYDPQPYSQGKGGFVPYMSVVDCLARHGPEKTLDLVRAGRMLSALM